MTENIEYIFPIGKLSGINCLKGNMLNMIKPIILPLRWTYKKKKRLTLHKNKMSLIMKGKQYFKRLNAFSHA